MSIRKRVSASILMLALMLSLTPAYAAESGASMGNFKATAAYTAFPDVAGTAWFAADVQKACELGIMTGKSGGVFDPMGGLSLAEAVTMAAKTYSIYQGDGFTPGGTPWYQNAVDYAVEQGIVIAGEYIDYTQPATKSDMAGMFAYALDNTEYTRINRIASIPDVDGDTNYVDYIFLLYNAGILTGDGTHAFHPSDGVSRAEAAAIINRVALPESRKQFTIDTPVAWGKTVTSEDGSFRVNVPDGWKSGSSDGSDFYCELDNETAQLQIVVYSKKDNPNYDPWSIAEFFLGLMTDAFGKDAVSEDITPDILRGLAGTRFRFEGKAADGDWSGSLAYTVENSSNHYVILLNNKETCTDEQWAQLWDIVYSLDFTV